ncbi:hypothetical protein Btru_017061 [Bulinus truncatus]|nr:hypothetical protein Btru_017061 [Bulinus truncatus]
MKLYPGFVQVETFHNLRRLFRDYGFRFRILRKKKPYGAKVEFRHPHFLRDSPDMILRVKKRNRWQLMVPKATSSPKHFTKNKKWQVIPSPPMGQYIPDTPESSQHLSIDSESTCMDFDVLDCSDLDSRSNTMNSSYKHALTFTFDDHHPGPNIPKANKHKRPKSIRMIRAL